MNEDNKIILLEQQFKDYKIAIEKEINTLRESTNDQEQRLRKMETSKEKTDFQYEQIMDTLNKLNNITIPNLTMQIEELKNKPTKRYDQVVTGIISAVVAGIMGFISAKITGGN